MLFVLPLLYVLAGSIPDQRISQARKFSWLTFSSLLETTFVFPNKLGLMFVNSGDIDLARVCVFSANSPSRDDVCPHCKRRLDGSSSTVLRNLYRFLALLDVSPDDDFCCCSTPLLPPEDEDCPTLRRFVSVSIRYLRRLYSYLLRQYYYYCCGNCRSANAYTMSISFINQAELWIVPVVFFPHRR